VVHASVVGVSALTYGDGARAAHLSKGGLQRYFASKEAMQIAVLRHGYTLMIEATFGFARERAPRHNPEEAHKMAFSRWLQWIGGELALPGGCILIPSLGAFNDEDSASDQAVRAVVAQLWQDWTKKLATLEETGRALAALGLRYHVEARVLKLAQAKNTCLSGYQHLMPTTAET
jgi:AcrR family transcriptional regulator